MELVLHPKSEIDTRIKRLQRRMGEITARYFPVCRYVLFLGYGPRGSSLHSQRFRIVMIKKSLERAEQESPLNVMALRSLKMIKTDLGITPGSVIGLELDVLPYNNYSRVQHDLVDAKIVDISEKIKHIRSIKSKFEIDLDKEASKMVDTGIESVVEHLKEGMSEIELAGKVEAVMRSMGHQVILHFRRFNHELHHGHIMSGPNAAIPSFVASPTGGRGVSLIHPQGAGFKKIKRNEPLLVDYTGVYNGYIADETRIFSICKIPQNLEDAHIASLEIQKAIANKLSTGKTGRELFNLSEAKGLLLGYENQLGGPPGKKCGFVGHGFGLEIDDYPILEPVDHQIQANMTIAVEPKMIYPEIGVVGVEDTFLTTTGKAERLTRLPHQIWRL